VVCSVNPEKQEPWFTPEECKEIWLNGYELPVNVEVNTLTEFLVQGIALNQIVMIRGLRDESDADEEKKIMIFNWKKFGITKFFFIITDEQFRSVSSSAARKAAKDVDLVRLPELVSPQVVTKLLQKSLNVKNISLVVGPPGSGKSTFMKKLCALNSKVYYVNADDFNKRLKGFLKEKFGDEDLVDLILKNEEVVQQTIKLPWLALLAESLKAVSANSYVFVEAAYGLQSDKRLYRFVGGRVLYIGCEDKEVLRQRINGRGTPKLTAFLERIPGKDESLRIAKENRLMMSCLDTSTALSELDNVVSEFNQTLL
jgi:phosphopantetheine adenylyltransferase